MRIKKAFVTILVSFLLLSLPCAAMEKVQATEITENGMVALSGIDGNAELLRDDDESTGVRFENGGIITLENAQKTAALYLVWDFAPKEWWLHTHQGKFGMGKSRFLHQYVTLPSAQSNVEISFDGVATLCEVRQLTDGTLPPNIQNWQPPLKDADMLLLPTHADDEHIYFGGIIPTYTARGKAVQVAYMVNHSSEPYRQHELLNGLWHAGIRNYPIIPSFPDVYSNSLEHAKTIYDAEALMTYQVELIRRFSPEVIIGHDVNGEYGHGAHMLNAATLQKSVVAAADVAQYPYITQKYGAWDTPKTYLHLWSERSITMDWNQPLEAFSGASAFEMSVNAFDHHVSQREYFAVEQSGLYDCRKFGLYRTTVGDDREKDDLFEHITAKEG